MNDNSTRQERGNHSGGPCPGDGRRGHTHQYSGPARTEHGRIAPHGHGPGRDSMRDNSIRQERGTPFGGHDRDRGRTPAPGRMDEAARAQIAARGRGHWRERDMERGPGPDPRHGGPEGRPGHEGHGSGRGPWNHGRGEGRERLERGMLRYVILDVVSTGPRHGYEIIKQIEEQTQGRYTPSPGTLYPTLQYLEDLGFVNATQDEGRKVYSITPGGQAEREQHAEAVAGFWSRFAAPGATGANQYEVNFLRDALDDLSRTVWSSLRPAMAGDDAATIRAVRQAVEQCQNAIRDIVAQAGTPRIAGNQPQQNEQ
jgi:DNA-binding PadR family transcriptional regulator